MKKLSIKFFTITPKSSMSSNEGFTNSTESLNLNNTPGFWVCGNCGYKFNAIFSSVCGNCGLAKDY